MMSIDIVKSDHGPYYTMYVNGKFEGNYDTYSEAIKDASEIFDEYALNESIEMVEA